MDGVLIATVGALFVVVEAEVCAQLSDLLRRGVLPEQEHHRVTHILEQQERDERHRDHDDHSLHQPLHDKGQHAVGT